VPEDKSAAPAFEAAMAEIEKIVERMESGELSLEASLELFERGVLLSDACRKQLDEAETRVEILLKKGRKVEPAPMPPQS
jgi:exodeoxyribonuclease VII small subunit